VPPRHCVGPASSSSSSSPSVSRLPGRGLNLRKSSAGAPVAGFWRRGLASFLLAATAAWPAGSRAAEVLLTWRDNAAGEQGYRLERSDPGHGWQEIAQLNANATSYIDANPASDVTYSYRVRAFGGDGFSAYSNVATARLSLPAPLNTAPRVGALADVSILAGSTAGPLTVMVEDAESPAGALSVTARSSNLAVVRNEDLRLSGQGAQRTLLIAAVPDASGTSTITVTVSDGSLEASTSFQLAVRLAEVAPTLTVSPRPTSAGAGERVVLRAEATAAGPISWQWLLDGVPVAGATSAELVIPSAQPFHAGSYQVRATSGGRSVLSSPVSVTIGETATGGSRLLNLSTRAWCGTGDQVLIPGFVTAGADDAQVLIRAVGPTLAQAPFSIGGTLPDPRLSLRRWNGVSYTELAANTDWGRIANLPALLLGFSSVSAFDLPAGSRDAALLTALSPGQHTVIVEDEARRTGITLVEIYDAEPGAPGASLTNLSNRGLVGSGDRVMIQGFVVSPEGPVTLLLRAVGPGLARDPFNVSGVLPDPVFDVYGSDGSGATTRLFGNDDWSDNQDHEYTAMVAARVSAFALDAGSRDAALVVTLHPGAYTMIVKDAADGARQGIALAEIYTVP
jgi:hypothetical protein